MTELVVNWSKSGFDALSGTANSACERLSLQAPSREVLILGLILCFLQVLDGILTGIGVATLGLAMEGNVLLRSIMESLGHTTGLVIVKSFAIVAVLTLTALCSIVPWLKSALRVMIGIYLVAAIIPWTAILIGRFA